MAYLEAYMESVKYYQSSQYKWLWSNNIIRVVLIQDLFSQDEDL